MSKELIAPCHSPYSATATLVPKKNRKLSGLPGSVSKWNKNLPPSTGISRRGNQKHSSSEHEDRQVCSQTGKYFENCRDNANVQPHLS